MVRCPICQEQVVLSDINGHLDSGCQKFIATHRQTPASFPLNDNETDCAQRESRAITLGTTERNPLKHSDNSTAPFAVKRNLTSAVPQSQSSSASKSSDTGSGSRSTGLLAERRHLCVAPLAEQVRPRSFDHIIGQEPLIGPNGTLRRLIERDDLPNLILWGPPGSGKTTIARIIAPMMGRKVYEISSLTTTTTEYQRIVTEAAKDVHGDRETSIVFCDEIHRLTRPQQDIFLEAVRGKRITLIGATTENPSLNIRHALVYRCKVFTVAKPTTNDIAAILRRALESQTLQPSQLLDDEFVQYIASFADGDSRTALNVVEIAADLCRRPDMTREKLKHSLTKSLLYDRSGDQHYDTISAFHKSVRGSDPDAALYYLARMLQSGENPLFIARRLVVAASEDVGLANNALQIYATSVYVMIEKLGISDTQSALAQLVVTMCLSKKSTRSYRGLNNALAALKEPGMSDVPVPFLLLDRRPELLSEAAQVIAADSENSQESIASAQGFLPGPLRGRKFLEDTDFLFKRDPDLAYP
ncbi:DNA polymerase III, clamp loader complex, gamma/delta/delta subunit [Aspergillus carlsbadensis]|nr:DNA polymerase III, clamp loader complex, gamma/delta/delta subunit [Aspergillus carlsbadensis]